MNNVFHSVVMVLLSLFLGGAWNPRRKHWSAGILLLNLLSYQN